MISFIIIGVADSGYRNCPLGFYCPEGTGEDRKKCPFGTYGSKEMLAAERECTPCDAGKYCRILNNSKTTGDCDAGYFCISGVDSSSPEMTNLTHCPSTYVHLSVGGICPVGHECPEGSKIAKRK